MKFRILSTMIIAVGILSACQTSSNQQARVLDENEDNNAGNENSSQCQVSELAGVEEFASIALDARKHPKEIYDAIEGPEHDFYLGPLIKGPTKYDDRYTCSKFQRVDTDDHNVDGPTVGPFFYNCLVKHSQKSVALAHFEVLAAVANTKKEERRTGFDDELNDYGTKFISCGLLTCSKSVRWLKQSEQVVTEQGKSCEFKIEAITEDGLQF